MRSGHNRPREIRLWPWAHLEPRAAGKIQVRPQKAPLVMQREKGRHPGRGCGRAAKQRLGTPPRSLHPLPAACRSASLPPPPALCRSMLPLLTAENRARLPAPCPAPPARLRPPRDSPRNEKSLLRKPSPGAGPAEGAAGVTEASLRARGKEDRETQITALRRAERAKGNERAAPYC